MTDEVTNQSPQEAVPTEYTSVDLKHLSDREHVRKRPGMYIGDTGQAGLHYLIEYAIELMLGGFESNHVSDISISIHVDGSVTLQDDNVGCQLKVIDRSDSDDRATTNLEDELCSVRFHSSGHSIFGYNTHFRGGLHGLPISIVNILSSWFRIEVCGESEVYRQEYRQGEPLAAVQTMPRTGQVGTRISFLPDPEIFSDAKFVFARIKNRLQVLSFLHAGLKTSVSDERTKQACAFHNPSGLQDYLDHVCPDLHRSNFRDQWRLCVDAEVNETTFQVALRPANSLVSYINDIHCSEGGAHQIGFFSVLTDVLNEIGIRKSLLDPNERLPQPNDYESQVTGIISVRLPDPKWQGATRTKVGNEELVDFANQHLRPQVVDFFGSHPNLATQMINAANG